jgi:hypothetical protein
MAQATKGAHILVAFMVAAAAFGQQRVDVDWYCNYYGEELEPEIYSFVSDSEAETAVRRIVDYTGIVQNFVIKAANVPNAAATIVGQQRAIYYSQDFMERVKNATRTDWAAISILAHEIGHHLQGHTIQGGGSRPEIELEADKYSGFVLERMGSTLDDAQAAIHLLGTAAATATHPSKSARIAAITSGWKASRDMRAQPAPTTGSTATSGAATTPTTTPSATRPPIPTTTPSVTTPAPSSPFRFVSRCVFPTDATPYYVTATNEIVAVAPNGQFLVIGRKIPPTAYGFAWMYQTGTVLYGVTPEGMIVGIAANGMPVQVGYVVEP